MLNNLPAEWSTMKKLLWLRGMPANQWGSETLTLTAFASPTTKTVSKKSHVTSCAVSYSLSQDLHGYANPWPAGGGKNKLENRLTNGTTGGVVYERLSDGGITAVGTVSSISASRDISRERLPNGTYILSGGNSSINLRVNRYDSDDNLIDRNTDSGSGVTIVVDDTVATLVWLVKAATLNEQVNTTVYPMVRLSTESDATYAPYSNICPITGWQGADVYIEPSYDPTATPKASVTFGTQSANQWDEEWEIGSIGSSGEKVSDSNNTIRSKNYIPCKPSKEYYITPYSGSSGAWVYAVYQYKEDKSFIGQVSISSTTQKFTTASNAYYLMFRTYVAYGTTYNHDIAINLPSSVTTYNPYRDYILGGTAEIVAGTGNETLKEVVFDGSNDEQWSAYSGNRVTVTVSDYTAPSNSTVSPIKANYLKTVAKTAQGATSGLISGSDSGSHAIMINIGLSSVSDVRAYLAENPLQVSYPLATPTPFTFTPSPLDLQKGENECWAEMTNT